MSVCYVTSTQKEESLSAAFTVDPLAVVLAWDGVR